MQNDEPLPRPASRVLVLDARDRLLLFRADGDFEGYSVLWLPPGGGLDPGETHEAAALRELREETGIEGATLGPCVWMRNWVGRYWGGGPLVRAEERYYVCRIDAHEIDEAHYNPDDIEREHTNGYRWWTYDEILACDDALFVPRNLAELLPAVLRGEHPAEPFWVDTPEAWL